MNKPYVIANWKCNKTMTEASVWMDRFEELYKDFPHKQLSTVIVCVPFTLLYFLEERIRKNGLPIILGAQDVSPFEDGAYTGEISARQLKELADYVIIGHTERRKYFHESDDILAQKTMLAKQAGLSVIYCIFEETARVPQGADIVSYEPVWAIGTGKADTPENAGKTISTIKQRTAKTLAIYGGSVTPENVHSFLSQESINGVLPGKASLDPQTFFQLVQQSTG